MPEIANIVCFPSEDNPMDALTKYPASIALSTLMSDNKLSISATSLVEGKKL